MRDNRRLAFSSLLPTLGLIALLAFFAPTLHADWCSEVGCDNACDRCRTLDNGLHTCCLGCECRTDDDAPLTFTSDEPTPRFLLTDQLMKPTCRTDSSSREITVEEIKEPVGTAQLSLVEDSKNPVVSRANTASKPIEDQ